MSRAEIASSDGTDGNAGTGTLAIRADAAAKSTRRESGMKTPPDGWDEHEREISRGAGPRAGSADPRGTAAAARGVAAPVKVCCPRSSIASAHWLSRAACTRTRARRRAERDRRDSTPTPRRALFARISREATALDARAAIAPWLLAGGGGGRRHRHPRLGVVDDASRDRAPRSPDASPRGPAPRARQHPSRRRKRSSCRSNARIRISLRALTWRGRGPDNPVLVALKPALDAFRAGDYATADREFSMSRSAIPI